MSDERGFTLVELLVAMAVGTIILLAAFNLIDRGTHATGRIAGRVEANQRARPVMQRIMDQLHSSCVADNVTPIMAGSTATQMQFLTQTGSTASITPDKHVITLAGTTLTDATYKASPTTPTITSSSTSWTFSSAVASTRELLTGVASAMTGSPSVATPLFQYYAYVSGQLSSTPLAVPLTAATAKTAAAVTVSFAATPSAARDDSHRAVTLSDTATMRFTAPDEDSTVTELPCE